MSITAAEFCESPYVMLMHLFSKRNAVFISSTTRKCWSHFLLYVSMRKITLLQKLPLHWKVTRMEKNISQLYLKIYHVQSLIISVPNTLSSKYLPR